MTGTASVVEAQSFTRTDAMMLVGGAVLIVIAIGFLRSGLAHPRLSADNA